jgi:hypothetical protein
MKCHFILFYGVLFILDYFTRLERTQDESAVAVVFAIQLKIVIATENKTFCRISLFKFILELTGHFSRFRGTTPDSCFTQIRFMACSVIPISLLKFLKLSYIM